MKVVLVCSHPSDCLRSPLAARPARMADGVVAEILTFVPGQFAALGLPGAPC